MNNSGGVKRAIPRLLIAGTHSGCGKTTVASGLMAALTARGLRVQPFKTGPDFIDPSHHTKICGRVSRNLDPFMMGRKGVLRTFCGASDGADIAVIEGVMGLFDGVDGTDCASTAHVAKILRAPVILVADVKGMSRSVNALIQGFRMFDPGVRIAGVIANRIGSCRHRDMIEKEARESYLGWIPRKDDLKVPSRHLGLTMAHEDRSMEQFGGIVRDHCDLDGILHVAESAAPLCPEDSPSAPCREPSARIGVALDPAFCFYYQDNLDTLRACGADLVFFSPLSGHLPDVDGVYLGGGYPELYLPELSASGCRTDITRAAGCGMPVLGECGGLMYLTGSITAEKTYQFCGALPATAEMTGSVQALGYVKGKAVSGWPCIPAGEQIRGHEFHYSRVIPERDARFSITLRRGKGICDNQDGIVEHCTIGTYTHAYFSRTFAEAFVSCCAAYHNR